MTKKQSAAAPTAGNGKKTKLECLAIEAAARAAVGKLYGCEPVARHLALEFDGPTHEFDIFCPNAVIGGVSTSPLRTKKGQWNTAGADRAVSEVFWLTLWSGDESRVHVATDRALSEWLYKRYRGAAVPVKVAIYHFDQAGAVLTCVGQIGPTVNESNGASETACRQEAARLLRSAARHSHELVISKSRVEPRKAASLMTVKLGELEYTRSVAALRLISRMFADVADCANERSPDSVLKAARRRGDKLQRELIATEQLVCEKDLLATIELSRQGLAAAVRAGRMFFFECDGEKYYPAFFAVAAPVRRRLGRVVKTLKGCASLEQWLFLTTPKSSLGRSTPIEAFRDGRIDKVLRAASAHMEL